MAKGDNEPPFELEPGFMRAQIHDWVDQIFDQEPEGLTFETPSEVMEIQEANEKTIRRAFTGWHSLRLRWKGKGLLWSQEVKENG